LGEPTKVIDSDPPGFFPGIADIQAGNVNGDAFTDLVILFSYFDGSPNQSVATWADGLGDGSFSGPFWYYYPNNSYLYPLLPPADLNGDGLPDLTYPSGYFQVLGPPTKTFGTFLGHDEEVFSRFRVGSDCCQSAGQFVDLDGDGF